MKILMPAFIFKLLMQRTASTIADVVPNVLMMLSKWNRMEVGGNYRLLCELLTNAFKHKFNYELNSPVYAVASLFNISKLKEWVTRKGCEELRSSVSFQNKNETDLNASAQSVISAS